MLYVTHLTPVEAGSSTGPEQSRCAPPGTPLEQMRNFIRRCEPHGIRIDLCERCFKKPYKPKNKSMRGNLTRTCSDPESKERAPNLTQTQEAERMAKRRQVLSTLVDGAKSFSHIVRDSHMTIPRVSGLLYACRKFGFVEGSKFVSLTEAGRKWLDDFR